MRAALVFAAGVLALWGAAPALSHTAAAEDPVIAAAGDIACDPASPNFNDGRGANGVCRQLETSDLLANGGYDAVLPLGDNQYYCGSFDAFQQSYDRSWGRVKHITHPVVGNHEYLESGPATGPSTGCDQANAGAAGHFLYFGMAAGKPGEGWYSYDLGEWHVIALNSNCGDVGGCDPASAQGRWLAADLAAHRRQCTLAYWHIPLFSSGGRAEANSYWLWDQLYRAGADLVLAGHDHTYERFAPQTPSGALDERTGITQFVVGTGGSNPTTFPGVAPNSEVRNATTFGVQRLTLHPWGYSWKFVPVPGGTFTDSGSRMCHGAPSDPEPARALFADGFEGQDLKARWTSVTNLSVQQQEVFSGAWAARATSTAGTAAWAYKSLAQPQSRLITKLRFKVLSQGNHVLDLLKLRTATGTALLTVFVADDRRLGFQNNVSGLSTYSTTTAARNSWHTLEVRTTIDGPGGKLEFVLDDQIVHDLTRTENLGSTPIGRLQIAENITGRSYDAAFDDLTAETG